MEKSPFFLQNALKKSQLYLNEQDDKKLGSGQNVTHTGGRDVKGSTSGYKPPSMLRGNAVGLNLCSAPVEKQQWDSNATSEVTAINGSSATHDDPVGYLRFGKLTRRPMNEGAVEPVTPKKGKVVAVCSNCGGLTEDFAYCDYCRKPLPPNSKSYEMRNDLRLKAASMDKSKFYRKCADGTNHVGVAPRKPRSPAASNSARRLARSSRKRMEPVCLTISSDEEGENSMNSEETCNDMNTINVCSESERKNSGRETLVAETAKNENGVIHCLLSTEQPMLVQPQQQPQPSDGICQDGVCTAELCLPCRTIRVGSYKFVPDQPVRLSPEGISFRTRAVSGDKEVVQVDIRPRDLVKILANFSACLPTLFVFTTPGCAGLIRNRLKMSYKSGPCYDPGSEEESQKRITFVLCTISCDEKNVLYRIFSTYDNEELVHEIDKTLANEILLRSTPVQVRNKIRTLTAELVPKPVTRYDIETRSATATSVIRSTTPAVKLMTYPPPPQTGGITITLDDFNCLEEGEFLNDVIIDFYLKYLVLNVLSESNRKRTHVFSSFFYRRLMTRPTSRQAAQENPKLSAAENRHSRVKTWTRHVDIFDKDFIIIPINESSHWFLAVICFPYLDGPVPFSAESSRTSAPESPSVLDQGNDSSLMEVDNNDDTQPGPNDLSVSFLDAAEDANKSIESEKDLSSCSATTPTLASPTPVTEKGLVKQPCILIFDSLSGSGRNRIISILRDYLQVEWKVKKKSCRVFSKDHMRGGIPEVPQQRNYSDCGIYVLQYVESFFEEPIQNYKLPMKMKTWFSDEHVGRKREQLKALIQKLSEEQSGKAWPVNGSVSTSTSDGGEEQTPAAAAATNTVETQTASVTAKS